MMTRENAVKMRFPSSVRVAERYVPQNWYVRPQRR